MTEELPRPLRGSESALVSALLARMGSAGALAGLTELEVVDVCQCGCSSFELAPAGSNRRPNGYGHKVADAYAVTPDGKAVGLILWGTAEHLTYMELYSLASDPPFELPSVDTITDMPAWPEPEE
jgi:hypothetical protein